MQYIKKDVFEKLLFPIHQDILSEIDTRIAHLWRTDKHALSHLESLEEQIHYVTPDVGAIKLNCPDNRCPVLDVHIQLSTQLKELRLSLIERFTSWEFVRFDFSYVPIKSWIGSHMTISIRVNNVVHNYIVPMAYLLGFKYDDVMRNGSYQLYTHTFSAGTSNSKTKARASDQFLAKLVNQSRSQSRLYYGITKQTWQVRYKQHLYAARNGSTLLFHQALSEALYRSSPVTSIEHVVERAGLDLDTVLKMEEEAVFNHSYHFRFPEKGLNMIPGGKAGLKLIANWANRGGKPKRRQPQIDPEFREEQIEDTTKQAFKTWASSTGNEIKSSVLQQKWMDPDFRRKAMLNREDRFSYEQLQVARALHAAEYTLEEIHSVVKQMDDRRPCQVDRLRLLIEGKTYGTIPPLIVSNHNWGA